MIFKKKLFESVKNMWSAHWTNYVCKSGIHSTVQPRERKEIFCSQLYIFLAYFDKSVCQGGLHCYTEFDCSLRLCRYTVFYNVLFFSVRTFSLWPWRSVHNSGQVLKFLQMEHSIVFVILISLTTRFNTKGSYKIAGNWL